MAGSRRLTPERVVGQWQTPLTLNSRALNLSLADTKQLEVSYHGM